MTQDWTPLDQELARWADAGLTLPLWWRDDDAVASTPALDRLAALADGAGLPVHLAVIPSGAQPDLAYRLASEPDLIPLVHGWAHQNHAPRPQKKAEFGASRPLAARVDDAGRGLAALTELLGRPPAPVFVPPWNRIAPDMAPALAGLGFRALSVFGPRDAAMAASGLARINTHLDPIDWRGTRSLVSPERLIDQLVGDLADRREGRTDGDEPYGLLTHHLVQDGAIWAFTQALLTRLMAGPVVPWRATSLNPNG